MKTLLYISFLLFLMVSCKPDNKVYKVTLVGQNGYEDEVKEIVTTTDSIAYEQALLTYYGAKVASKQYGLPDKYAYMRVVNDTGNSLEVELSVSTIKNIKDGLSKVPKIKEIQEDDEKLPKF